VADLCDPIQCNSKGLDCFAAGDPEAADALLRKAYRNLASEMGILVNLGLALMQQGLVDQAERAYRLALNSDEQRVRRSAAKNLGFLLLWRGDHQQGWHWHSQRFEGESFESNQWQGDPLNGTTLTIWNDVGMGDAFQFVRYTLPLLQRGEKVRFAVAESQIPVFREHLAWPLNEVIDRRAICPAEAGPHIPLMSLIPLLDSNTLWGRHFAQPTWKLSNPANDSGEKVGFCWASNPQDRTMHAYKSCAPEQLLTLQRRLAPGSTPISLQTDEPEAHQRLSIQPAQRDWSETLKRIGRCSSVISVDTAVAHLSAGSERPTTLLLGDPPDWRWRQIPEDPQAPLWYPSLRVNRQTLKPALHP
tara:strand:- start:340 stop:1419 length:1080 start_codon:yes stop_codon:yes gene_type:complete